MSARWSRRREPVVSLRFGYVSNGLSDHRLEDALELLAENGYSGVALTLDHIHFDPLAPRLRARAARLRVRARGARAGRAWWRPARASCSTRAASTSRRCVSDGRQRRVDLLCTAVDVAVELGAPVVSMWSGVAPAERAARARLGPAGRRLRARARARRAQRRSRSRSSPSPGCWSRRWPTTRCCTSASATRRRSGLTLDIGHIVCLEPMSVTECVRRGAPTLAHVHIEDMRRGVHEHLMFGEGELDLDEALGVLDRGRLRGDGRRRALAPLARRARGRARARWRALRARRDGRWWRS